MQELFDNEWDEKMLKYSVEGKEVLVAYLKVLSL
jgi:hypothetical protein